MRDVFFFADDDSKLHQLASEFAANPANAHLFKKSDSGTESRPKKRKRAAKKGEDLVQEDPSEELPEPKKKKTAGKKGDETSNKRKKKEPEMVSTAITSFPFISVENECQIKR